LTIFKSFSLGKTWTLIKPTVIEDVCDKINLTKIKNNINKEALENLKIFLKFLKNLLI
jgi:hypothetical protein